VSKSDLLHKGKQMSLLFTACHRITAQVTERKNRDAQARFAGSSSSHHALAFV